MYKKSTYFMDFFTHDAYLMNIRKGENIYDSLIVSNHNSWSLLTYNFDISFVDGVARTIGRDTIPERIFIKEFNEPLKRLEKIVDTIEAIQNRGGSHFSYTSASLYDKLLRTDSYELMISDKIHKDIFSVKIHLSKNQITISLHDLFYQDHKKLTPTSFEVNFKEISLSEFREVFDPVCEKITNVKSMIEDTGGISYE